MQRAQKTIRDAATARLFVKYKHVRLLEPFIQAPQTLSDAAAKLGVKAPHLHYHVKRFLEYGLLEVVPTEKRNGRKVKLYQTTAKDFFIPFELTSSETLEGLMSNLAAPARTKFISANAQVLEQISPNWGIRWSHNGEDTLYHAMLPEELNQEEIEKQIVSPEGPALVSFQDALTLNHEAVKALQHDFVELSQHNHALQTPNGQRYAIHIGLVPAIGR